MTKKVKNHFKIAILLETPPRTSLTVYNLQGRSRKINEKI